jgi:hypothetical protein
MQRRVEAYFLRSSEFINSGLNFVFLYVEDHCEIQTSGTYVLSRSTHDKINYNCPDIRTSAVDWAQLIRLLLEDGGRVQSQKRCFNKK